MTKAKCIEAFPPDLDRQRFGDWLSGFADGEATFCLLLGNGQYSHRYQRQYHRKRPSAAFAIMLRADDEPILRLIRSFWQGGTIQHVPRRRNDNPAVSLVVANVPALVGTVVPHF